MEQMLLKDHSIILPNDTSKVNLRYLLDLGLYPIVRLSENGLHVILRYYEPEDIYSCNFIRFYLADKSFIEKVSDSDFLRHNVCIIKRDD